MPLNASVNTRIVATLNDNYSGEALSVFRKGVKLMWQAAPDEMKNAKVQPMKSYDRYNHHRGLIWGWPFECNLTDTKVKRILRACIASRQLTIDQLRQVRKSLSYAYLLVHNAKGENWNCVKTVWATIGKGDQLPGKKQECLPKVIARAKDVKRAFTREWFPGHPQSLLQHSAGVVAAHDIFWGGRAGDDGCISRIKKSRTHGWNVKEGYMWTTLEGGRCKLPNEVRPWKIYTVCYCDTPNHRSPPPNLHRLIDQNGNPTVPVTYCTTCPIAALELKWQYPEARGRRYAKVRNGRFVNQNDWDIMKVANDWMFAQRVITRRLSHNSGRKTLARLLTRVNATYPEGFENHGDLENNWRASYQPDLPINPVKFTRRKQSTDPDVCCVAPRKIARYFGRGPMKMPPLDTTQQFLHALVSRTDAPLAERIRSGEPTKPESDSEPELPPIDWEFWKQQILPPPLPPVEPVVKAEAVVPKAEWMPANEAEWNRMHAYVRYSGEEV